MYACHGFGAERCYQSDTKVREQKQTPRGTEGSNAGTRATKVQDSRVKARRSN